MENNYEATKAYEEAIKAYEQTIEIDPRNPISWGRKGLALKMLGRKAEAKAAFDKARLLNGMKGLNNEGFLVNDSYLKILENGWKNGAIDDERFLSEAQSLLKGKKINESVYDRLKEEVSNALVEAANAGEVSVNLQKYTDAFLSGSLSKGAYLNLIDGMWERGDLGDDQYLGQLKDLKDKGELNSTDFDQRSTKVQDKIIGSANSDTGDYQRTLMTPQLSRWKRPRMKQ